MNPDQLFDAYGQAHNVRFVLDGSGNARLAFDATCAVDIQYRREEATLILQAALPVPANADPRLLRTLLAANLFHSVAGNPVLALDAAAGEIVLLARLDAEDWQLDLFEDRLQSLLDEYTAWEKLLAGGARALDNLEAAGSPTPGVAPAPGMLA